MECYLKKGKREIRKTPARFQQLLGVDHKESLHPSEGDCRVRGFGAGASVVCTWLGNYDSAERGD